MGRLKNRNRARTDKERDRERDRETNREREERGQGRKRSGPERKTEEWARGKERVAGPGREKERERDIGRRGWRRCCSIPLLACLMGE